MDEAVRELLSDEVAYLDQTALEELTGDGGRYVNGATLIDIGPFRVTERPDVVGIDVSTSRGSFDVLILTFLFRWDGVDWVDAEAEDTGVTVTSAVS